MVSSQAEPASFGPSGCIPKPAPTPKPPPKTKRNSEGYEQYRQYLDTVTCACGYGYYNDDDIWVPGNLVRAGKKPQRDGTAFAAAPVPDEAARDGE
jgi:hypothetical protein